MPFAVGQIVFFEMYGEYVRIEGVRIEGVTTRPNGFVYSISFMPESIWHWEPMMAAIPAKQEVESGEIAGRTGKLRACLRFSSLWQQSQMAFGPNVS